MPNYPIMQAAIDWLRDQADPEPDSGDRIGLALAAWLELQMSYPEAPKIEEVLKEIVETG